MKVEFKDKLDIVMHKGELPDKFYIILEGSVGVLIRKREEEIKKLKEKVGKR